MKRFLCILLCLLLLQGVVLAEGRQYGVLTSMEDCYGVWGVCSSNGDYEYLVLHDDSTYEAYTAWFMAETPVQGDALIHHGTYTFDPATGGFLLEGDDLAYTLQFWGADGLLSDDGGVEGTSDMNALLLYAESPKDDDEYEDPSKMFLPMSDGMVLLPTNETISSDDPEWHRSDVFHDFELDAVSYRFFPDGTGEFLAYTEADEADRAPLTYVLDNGAMTLTMADGTAHHWLMQFSYYLFSGNNSEQIDESMDIYFDEMDDEFVAYNAVWSDSVLLVHDLDNGTSFYLMATKG